MPKIQHVLFETSSVSDEWSLTKLSEKGSETFTTLKLIEWKTGKRIGIIIHTQVIKHIFEEKYLPLLVIIPLWVSEVNVITQLVVIKTNIVKVQLKTYLFDCFVCYLKEIHI